MEAVLHQNYTPTPFWAMDPITWQQYVGALQGDARSVLAYYPFDLPAPGWVSHSARTLWSC